MSDLTPYQQPPTDVATLTDPTGGRLVAWAQAARAANQLATALTTTTFVPQQMRNVGDATAAILAGDEVGLSPLAALRSIYVVHGTPAFYARTMVALALSHGHEIWTEESNDTKVTVRGRRRGSDNVETSTWTIQRAQKAGYTNNKKYATNPQEMLYSKAAAEVARKIAADVLAGMPHSVEDLELDDAPATTTVSRAATGTTTVRRARPAQPDPQPPAEQPAEDVTDAPEAITDAQSRKMGALMREAGLTDRAEALAYVGATIGRDIQSRSELTKAEASTVIDALERAVTEVPTDDLGSAYDTDELWPTTATSGGES